MLEENGDGKMKTNAVVGSQVNLEAFIDKFPFFLDSNSEKFIN